jgi:hypothetical protein
MQLTWPYVRDIFCTARALSCTQCSAVRSQSCRWDVHAPLGGPRRERRSHAAQPTPDSQGCTASLRCSRASTQSPQPHEEEDKCCGWHHHLRHHLEPSWWPAWWVGISIEFIRTPMKTDGIRENYGKRIPFPCWYLDLVQKASVHTCFLLRPMAQTPESCNCATASGTQSNKCQFYSKQVQTMTRVISSRMGVQRCGLHPGVCTQRVVEHMYVITQSVIVQLLSHSQQRATSASLATESEASGTRFVDINGSGLPIMIAGVVILSCVLARCV